jgi:cytochrome P450
VVRLSTFLFAAGQEATSKMLTLAVQTLGERPELQRRLREDRSLVPNFLEESLRLESPIKSHFRLAAKTTRVEGVPTSAGTTMMILPGAANRDPARFEKPDEFRLDRIFLRMADIRISETHHGPVNERRYSYDPSFMMRGLKDLHIEFTPIN